ncbi:MAG: DUF11 domain-containing protein [Candidatus Yanofskybacteria bacterium]|nr:DUF11 domain-containing protein [Candidatus Yanofskybacteria bacterium]
MSKKALIFGLFVAILASSVGGAFGVADARAESVPWYGSLQCVPSVQSVASGDYVSFTAYSANTGNQLTWSAVGGTPNSGYGSLFGTRFYATGSEVRTVTVSDGYQSAACTVYVYGTTPTYTWTPTPTPWTNLQCAPAYSSVNSGDLVSLNAWGGEGSFYWTAGDGNPSSGWGSSFSTRFYNYGSATVSRTVTVTSAGQSASCTVSVYGSGYWTPTPTITPYSSLALDHSVRNVTRGGEGSSVNAYANDRVQFIARITTGAYQLTNARIVDTLPSFVRYLSGTTNVEGTWYTDGITNGGLQLGTLAANRTYTVKFDATLDAGYASWQSLTNSVTVTADNAWTQTRTSIVVINGGTWTPTPTAYPYTDPNARMDVRQLGRNVTRGQSGEYAGVRARGGDTLDIVLRARSSTGSALYNAFVTELLPSGVNYIAGSTTVNGYAVADGITSAGISVGTLSPSTDTVIKFSVRVDEASVPSWGQVVVNASAQVRADGVGTMSAQLPITLGQRLSIATASSVQTGPTDSIVLALLIAALVTGLYAAYTRSAIFGRRMAFAEIGRLSRSAGLNFLK